MSFLTTHPEALAAAAGNLQTIGAALTAQNAAAAGPITGLAPAAADEVSMLQATQFSAYGTLYEQISAQAAAMQEMFVQTLRASGDSYGYTETANSAAAGLGTATSGIGAAAGAGTGAADPTFGLGGIASNSGILAAMQAGTIGSAASEFTGLGKGYITSPSGVVHHVDSAPGAAGLTSQVEPVGAAAVPVSPAVGQAPPATGPATPPSWAGQAAPAEAARAPLPTTGTAASAAPHTPMAAVPAGAPGSSTERGSGGRLRYGMKPKVMPRPPVG